MVKTPLFEDDRNRRIEHGLYVFWGQLFSKTLLSDFKLLEGGIVCLTNKTQNPAFSVGQVLGPCLGRGMGSWWVSGL